MGCHSLEEIVRHAPDRILKVFHQKISDQPNTRKTSLIESLKKLNKKLELCSKQYLDNLCMSTSHQGIAASLKEKAPFDFETFIKSDRSSMIVILDSIYDPHNLGAILRACECFGADLVIWSKNRGASLSPVVAKTSSSASEFVPIHTVSNLSTTCDQLKKEGFHIIGAQVTPNSQNLFTYTFPEKSALILGSEGEGIRAILQKKCDDSVAIPMFGKIDSLNVSQASALCLGFWKKQQL